MQTIRNDDLEEIRELGSGTYGSVFHGKWRGCDVAIKRIKASCFDGRPSERERLVCFISLLVVDLRIGSIAKFLPAKKRSIAKFLFTYFRVKTSYLYSSNTRVISCFVEKNVAVDRSLFSSKKVMEALAACICTNNIIKDGLCA